MDHNNDKNNGAFVVSDIVTYWIIFPFQKTFPRRDDAETFLGVGQAWECEQGGNWQQRNAQSVSPPQYTCMLITMNHFTFYVNSECQCNVIPLFSYWNVFHKIHGTPCSMYLILYFILYISAPPKICVLYFVTVLYSVTVLYCFVSLRAIQYCLVTVR